LEAKVTKGKNKTGKTAVAIESKEPRWSRQERIAKILDSLSSEMEKKIAQGEIEPGIGDLVKILQFQEQYQGKELPEEVRVIWLETEESKPGE
jgi:hypothetical protein